MKLFNFKPAEMFLIIKGKEFSLFFVWRNGKEKENCKIERLFHWKFHSTCTCLERTKTEITPEKLEKYNNMK
jgi:hypothetical protein